MNSNLVEPEEFHMFDLHDLEVAINSQMPLITIQSSEESEFLQTLEKLRSQLARSVCTWSITTGIQTLGLSDSDAQCSKPGEALLYIKQAPFPGIYVLMDFHPYLDDPTNVRLLKEISQNARQERKTIILLSHKLELPPELGAHSARFEISIPDKDDLEKVVRAIAQEWSGQNIGKKVKTEESLLQMLIKSLQGLPISDVKRLAYSAIFDDGAITQSDVDEAMKARYELLNKGGVVSFEYETAALADVAGLEALKNWLMSRKKVFLGESSAYNLPPPRGLFLLGVQGCGKSLAARAIAGAWQVPLLRFDFAAAYNKFIGETEKNLASALQTAAAMAPCVLWIDEIEKGLGTSQNDGGTSQRILGSFLTWMSERKEPVFIVATANDVQVLPPELLRKGRFDEIFFVDLPEEEARRAIFEIHLKRRELEPSSFEIDSLVEASSGFSGAEIEQAIVSTIYTCLAQDKTIGSAEILEELSRTRPLSVVMAEKVDGLRSWAAGRTVSAN